MGKQSEVLMKASSLAFHKTLVLPSDTSSAFKDIQGMVCKALSDHVLMCVWNPSQACMITIMKDLMDNNYQRCEPCNMSDVLVLWNSFAIMVQDLLLPLACNKVVHCDIGPGWDHTSNLICKNIEGEVQLRLTDYESLCNIMDCSQVPEDPRCFHVTFIPQSMLQMKAFAFLWWQCLFW